MIFALFISLAPPILSIRVPLIIGGRIGNVCQKFSSYSKNFPTAAEPHLTQTRNDANPLLDKVSANACSM